MYITTAQLNMAHDQLKRHRKLIMIPLYDKEK